MVRLRGIQIAPRAAHHHRSEGRQEGSRSTQRNGVGNVMGFFRWQDLYFLYGNIFDDDGSRGV